jgi:hypothetical protein
MHESIDDLTAPWLGAGVELATRMLALADEMEAQYDTSYRLAASMVRDVVRCDYDPLRPATKPLNLPRDGAQTEPGS